VRTCVHHSRAPGFNNACTIAPHRAPQRLTCLCCHASHQQCGEQHGNLRAYKGVSGQADVRDVANASVCAKFAQYSEPGASGWGGGAADVLHHPACRLSSR
jgi:hypothetical protein